MQYSIQYSIHSTAVSNAIVSLNFFVCFTDSYDFKEKLNVKNNLVVKFAV